MNVRSEPLEIDYLTPDELTKHVGRDWESVLGIALFAASGADITAPGVPVARVAAPLLGNRATSYEIWRATGPFHSGHVGPVRFRSNAELLFGCVDVSEMAADKGSDRTPLEQATEHAYAEIFRCVETRGFPHLLRMWNYVPDINGETAGVERYRQFNEARQQAFLVAGRKITGDVPAACALGATSGSPLIVYFLAAKRPGGRIENPRQISAYAYPKQYGRCSPTFSRASLSHDEDGSVLLVSGTSSIVGHRTMHAGDVVAQTRETIANIRALIAEANDVTREQRFAAERLKYKVYLRRPQDFHPVEAELCATLRPLTPIVYLQADVCRSDLLVEIEAVGRARRAMGH